MECFIIEEGAERKAGPEDIIPLLGDMEIQYILGEAYNTIALPYALAFMRDEIKSMVYRNLFKRIRGGIEKRVNELESTRKKEDRDIEHQKKELMSLFEKYRNSWLFYEMPLVWKEPEPKKEIQAETQEKEPPNPVEELIKNIEDACISGELYIWDSDDSKEDVQNAFAALKDKKNELQKIKKLTIKAQCLSAAAMLFEAGGIETLSINGKFSETWPEFLENYRTLTSIEICVWEGLTEFPEWIRNAASLSALSIRSSIITYIPDWICDMQSLTELCIECGNIKTVPDSIGNLKNLAKLAINYSSIEILPDGIGNLGNLAVLSLKYNKKLKSLPDSIGNLKNMTALHLRGSAIEKLPDAMANCPSLEYVDVCNTNIESFPDFIGSIKTLIQSREIIPKKIGNSYVAFCNNYYTLVEIILNFSTKARREGLLAIEDEVEELSDGVFRDGIRLVIDGTDGKIIREFFTLKIEREHDYYRKKLMEIALEGIAGIQNGDRTMCIALRLASMVDIKNNLIDLAYAKYIGGDSEAFDNIDFGAGIHFGEWEEKSFMERALEMSEISRREGLLGVESRLDNDRIMAKDVFEYGLSLAIDGLENEEIEKHLAMLIDRETDPVRKNLSLAKKHAVKMICEGNNPRDLLLMLSAYFDDDIAGSILPDLNVL